MLSKYRILFLALFIGCQHISYKPYGDYFPFESFLDFPIAAYKLKVEASKLLSDDSDSLEIKDFRINFTDYKDSVVYIGIVDQIIRSGFTTNDSLYIETREIISSFKPYGITETYFKDTYWARINFNYIKNGETYSDFSLLKMPFEKQGE